MPAYDHLPPLDQRVHKAHQLRDAARLVLEHATELKEDTDRHVRWTENGRADWADNWLDEMKQDVARLQADLDALKSKLEG